MVRRLRPILGIGSLAVTGACGLDLTGTYAGTVPDEAPVDAGTPPLEAAPLELDASAEAQTDVTGTSAPFCDPHDTALIGCFRFDDAFTDESAHAQILDVSGTFEFGDGIDQRAVVLDATSTLHAPDGPAWTYKALTVEMWIRPNALPAAGARAGLLDKDGAFGVFLHDDGSIQCIMQQSASAKIATPGTWTYLACVNDGSKTILYANGAATATVDAGALGETTSYAAIGSNAPAGDHFVGSIDDLRISARALSAAEIAASAARF